LHRENFQTMKRLLVILFFAPLLFAFTADLPNFSPIATAISAGNVDVLSKYLDTDVEISLFDKEESFEKDQASAVLKDFFAKNKPKSFSQVHQGTSKGKDTQYCIGEINTATGNYRMYIYMKVINDGFLIQEIRIGKN
jgi:hypothetical protein